MKLIIATFGMAVVCLFSSLCAANCLYSNPTIQMPNSALPLSKKEYLQQLRNIDELLCQLPKPSNLKIVFTEKGKDAQFDPETNTLKMSLRFLKYDNGKSAHPRQTLSILAHEYTHALFEHYMTLASPAFRLVRTIDKQIIEQANLMSEALGQYYKSTDPNEKEQINKKISEYSSNMDKLAGGAFYYFAYAANEYYADVIAVILSKDPRSIYSALHEREKDNSSSSVYYRDFSQNFGPSVMARWKQIFTIMWDGSRLAQMFTRYLGLAPLRSYTWEIIKGPVQNPANHSKMALTILNSIQNELEILAQRQVKAAELNIVEINQSVAKRIQTGLK